MLFIAPDVRQAQDLAVAYAQRYGEPLLLDEGVTTEDIRVLTSTATENFPVVRADTLAPRDRSAVAGLVRNSLVVAYGLVVPAEFGGVLTHVVGTRTALDTYQVLRDQGASDGEAARGALNFAGDVSAAQDQLALMQARERVLRCVNHIRAQDMGSLAAECERATPLDVTAALRSVVVEHESGRSVTWTRGEVGPLLDNVEYVAMLLPKGFVKNPSAVFYAVMVGVFYAYGERRQSV